MSRKVTPADRFRQELMEAVGEASLGFSGYCRRAAQAMLQTAMEVEAAQFIGRASYQRREGPQATYRNGYKRRKVTTGEGAVELFVPQTREGTEPFQTVVLGAYQRRSEVLYLFVDGMHLKLHPDRDQKQPVLIAYAILGDGKKVLLHIDVGDRECYEACLGFLRDMTERGLRTPVLYCSDDCPGLRKALRAVWPNALRQKCQAHKLL